MIPWKYQYIKMSNLVSVIIPTHNRAVLLDKAIKSILIQTHTNIEIVVVVDACTDGTLSILNKYEHDERFKIILSNSNVGGGEARNIGIENASGEFLAFLDDDDSWSSRKISSQLSVLQERKDICLVGCNYINISKGTEISKSSIPENITLEDMLYNNMIGSFSFCMTRSEHVKGLEITKSLVAAQDWELWLKILLKTKLNILVIPDHLVYYNCSRDKPRLTTNYVEALHSREQCAKIFWGHMNASQLRFNQAIILNSKSYMLEPNSILLYLRSIKYALLTINRFKLRALVAFVLRFWVSQWYKLKNEKNPYL